MTHSSSSTFSYTGTKLTLISGAVVAVLIMVLATVLGINPNQPQPTRYGGTQYPAPLTSLAAGCGDFFLYPPLESQYGVILDDDKNDVLTIPSHPMTVPVYGYMSETSMADSDIRLYEPDELRQPISLQTILRTMYDKDTTVVWYAEDISQGDFAVLRAYVRDKTNILVVPWEYGDNSLPLDRKVAFSQWGISQSCEFWTDETFETFLEFAEDNRLERNPNPRVVRPNENGLLPPIIVVN